MGLQPAEEGPWVAPCCATCHCGKQQPLEQREKGKRLPPPPRTAVPIPSGSPTRLLPLFPEVKQGAKTGLSTSLTGLEQP